ncbi:hypothetical protein SAMN05216276_10796 [Streptosporangium subroseum]|uniref:Uncharacterized protein n=1 Tax=Streptosporangium subroseum TaxID=106412 RepID=A0A239P0U1_9ACTN|nr:hypothetical protein SAMN05216276_10796 [Streptosporangium subroseum]
MSGDARIPYLGGTAPQSLLRTAASRIAAGEPYVIKKAA